MIKRIVFTAPCLLFTLLSCGIQEQGSTVQTITAPDNQPFKPVDDFWLYESNSGISAFTFDSSAPNIGFFPVAMPSNSQDLFWLKDGLTRMSIIPDTNVIKPRHREGLINRIVFPSQAARSGGFASASIVHRLFEGMKPESNSTMILRPTFEVRGPLGASLQAHFESYMVCFKILENDADPMRILKDDRAQSDRNLVLSRANEAETLQMELGFNKTNVGAFAQQCSALGGEVASQLSVEIRPLEQSADITVDFPGIAVHREFPALEKSKVVFAVSPNLPVNRDLKLEVRNTENKDMSCNIILKGKYSNPSDNHNVSELLIHTQVALINNTLSNDDTFHGSAELDAIGVPGIRYFSGEVMSYDCVEYIPRIR